jgi:nucleotide-binding universal stress UspA family protein
MRVPIKRILCPIDFSEFSRGALELAITVARWHDAEIKALHVLPVTLPTTPLGPLPVAMPFKAEPPDDQVEQELRTFVRPAVDAGLAVSVRVLVGQAVGVILDEAREWAADLIVLGTHGRSGFERLFLGSVAERVLRRATCPVLTAPRRQEQFPDAAVLFRRVLCPVDFSEASLAALEFAFAVARASDGNVTLLHVLEIEEEPVVPSPFSIPEYRRLREQDAHRSLDALVPAEAETWCRPETMVVGGGKAYREILRLAREKEVDLIVLGVHGRNPVDLTLFGSTTHHVVREATCPVLTVRPVGTR